MGVNNNSTTLSFPISTKEIVSRDDKFIICPGII